MLNHIPRYFSFFVLLGGFALAGVQFFTFRSLWLDEAMVALNISAKGYIQLLQPLDYLQVAPVFFLWLEKSSVLILGNHDWVLRLPPMLAFASSLIVLGRSWRIVLPDQALIFGFSILAFNPNLLFYASEVKPYIFDFLVVIVGITFLLQTQKNREIYPRYLMLYGIVSIYLSSVAVLMLFSLGLAIAIKSGNFRRVIHSHGHIFFCWLVAFIVYFLFFVYEHPHRATMLSYWEYHNGFLSMAHALQRIVNIYVGLVPFGKIGTYLIPGLLFLGIIKAFREKWFVLLTGLLVPVLLHVLLSLLKIYPLEIRFVLYWIPIVACISSIGFSLILDALKTRKYGNVELLLIPLIIIPFVRVFRVLEFPMYREEIKNSMNFIELHKKPSDALYVYYGAKMAFDFYRDRQFDTSNFGEVFYGSDCFVNPRLCAQEVANMNGRVWFLLSHFDSNQERNFEIIMKSRGEILENYNTYGSSAYLVAVKKKLINRY